MKYLYSATTKTAAAATVTTINKNRLCSKTCGIDKIIKFSKKDEKLAGFLFKRNL